MTNSPEDTRICNDLPALFGYLNTFPMFIAEIIVYCIDNFCDSIMQGSFLFSKRFQQSFGIIGCIFT